MNEIGVNTEDVVLPRESFTEVRVDGNTTERDTQDLPIPEASTAIELLTGPLD